MKKLIRKAEPSKSLSLSLPYLSVKLLFVLVCNLIQVVISAINKNYYFFFNFVFCASKINP